ncbi:hypothetical protein UZ35_09705 [Heyndrickxia coagulans]|nr:hypothetical protein CIW84_12805 [Heyndrickxia coagulans]KGB30827.1 hypothetical protein IE89_02160 [Heyndrickxia coagulans]KXT20357.1 hypothetical protein UZ35_09705 [Heyndrickxia coagulans]RCS34859.1 hypothetical protein DN050_18105 [Heyndrickxia coagulans]
MLLKNTKPDPKGVSRLKWDTLFAWKRNQILRNVFQGSRARKAESQKGDGTSHAVPITFWHGDQRVRTDSHAGGFKSVIFAGGKMNLQGKKRIPGCAAVCSGF